MIEVNYLVVLVAAIAAHIIGALWYGPLFGKRWMALEGVNPEESMTPEMKRGMWKTYLASFIGNLVMAYVLAHGITYVSAYLNVSGLHAGLGAAFSSWLGFIATIQLGTVLWLQKPWKLYFLNVAYYLVALLVMGAILGGWR